MLNKIDFINIFMENVEKERIEMNISQQKMADLLDVSLSTYKRMINGDVSKCDLYAAYKLFQVTGKYFVEFADKNNLVAGYMEKVRNLSESQLSFVKAIIDFEYDFRTSSEEPDEYISVLILTGDMEDGMIYDSANVVKMRYRSVLSSSIICGIKVTSNHLHPVYNSGDVILISKQPIRDGDIGVFINKENRRAYLRKFLQRSPCELVPVNDYGETFYVDPFNKSDMDKWIKYGKVLSKARSI